MAASRRVPQDDEILEKYHNRKLRNELADERHRAHSSHSTRIKNNS